jgi:hypothetical protein
MTMDQDFSQVAERFLRFVHRVTQLPMIICDDSGTIVKAVVRSRIGTPHAIAGRIVAGEFDEFAVTDEQEAADPRMKAGCNCLIAVDGQRLGSFGIAGPIELTRPLARIAAAVIASGIPEARQRRLLAGTAAQAAGAVSGLRARVAEAAVRGAEVMTRMTEASASATEQVARTDGVVLTVHELSQRSRILSINGSVEATRAGDAGRAFGVVSREMLELAEGARQQSGEIQATLRAVHQAIGTLGGAIQEAGQLARDQLGALEELTGVVETLQQAVTALASAPGGQRGV